MNVQRNLPRYSVIHLKPKIHFPTIDSVRFIVKDISLAGIQIYSNTKVTLRSFNQITLVFGTKEFELNINQVWGEEEPTIGEKYREILKDEFDEIHFRSGFRLKFSDKEKFLKWKNFVHAFHQHTLKKGPN